MSRGPSATCAEHEAAIEGPDGGIPEILTEVASAVSLQEGEAGVQQVLRAIQLLAPASTRSVSRHTGLPTPVVAAISNELRARGLVTKDRPSKLTPRGQALLGEPAPGLQADVVCDRCGGYGLADGPLAGLAGALGAVMAKAPPVDLTLDQSYCTVETKLRRVLFLLRHRLLPTDSMIVLGDDDLTAVAVAMAGQALGRPLVRRLAVVDVSPGILGIIGQQLADLDVTAELVQQDLRLPLPAGLAGGFALAMTDPPYTVHGARLFLSRATEALRPGTGGSVVFSFGAKGPQDTLRVQETFLELGLSVQAMHPGFNAYLGAGVIGGRSHLYHLAATGRTAPVITGAYTGPMYTAQARGADRSYLCLTCGARHVVGPGARWHTIGELKKAGCPACGGQRLRPLQLVPPGHGGA